MNVGNEVHIATIINQRVDIWFTEDTRLTGVAEVSTDPQRAKIRTVEGPVWVPYAEIENVSRIINLFHYNNDRTGAMPLWSLHFLSFP